MQYIKGIDAFREEKRTAVTLGKFDGTVFHKGDSLD
jgi:riboflavin kinase/FMN adenylyltransferase